MTKYLGVYIDEKLNWAKHIEYIETKLSSSIGVLYQLKRIVPREIMKIVYHSIAYSHLACYCMLGKHNCEITPQTASKAKLANQIEYK